jgi:hypothetical protein
VNSQGAERAQGDSLVSRIGAGKPQESTLSFDPLP